VKRLALGLPWGWGPIRIFALASAAGRSAVDRESDEIQRRTAGLSAVERRTLESAPFLAIANATWAYGSPDSVKKMLRSELDRLEAVQGPSRARVLVRFGVFDSNPDGQAAVFAQACVDDPTTCEHLEESAERETRARFVAPGNQLPPYFLGGHQATTGAR
jgi:hypothetical protein